MAGRRICLALSLSQQGCGFAPRTVGHGSCEKTYPMPRERWESLTPELQRTFLHTLELYRKANNDSTRYYEKSLELKAVVTLDKKIKQLEAQLRQTQKELPGVTVYADSQQDALRQVQALALQVLADKLHHGELEPEDNFSFEQVRG